MTIEKQPASTILFQLYVIPDMSALGSWPDYGILVGAT